MSINRKYEFSPLGFHGDKYLLDLIDKIVINYKVVNFIETGSHVGSTLDYFSNKYQNIKCFSCEPDNYSYNEVIKRIDSRINVKIYNTDSISYLNTLKKEQKQLFKEVNLFWLDAHGYGFKWPLKEEIEFITKNFKKDCFIFIDDFKNPYNTKFVFDSHENQECSYNYIKENINGIHTVYYPNYTQKTSTFHPLVGWGLIINKEIDLPFENIIK